MLRRLDDLAVWKKMLAAPVVAVCCLVALGVAVQRQNSALGAALGDTAGDGRTRVAQVAAVQASVAAAHEGASPAVLRESLEKAADELRQLASTGALPAEESQRYRACADRLGGDVAGAADGFLAVNRCLAEIVEFEARRQAQALRGLSGSSLAGFWVVGIGALLSAGIALFLANRVRGKVSAAEVALQAVATGDLRERASTTSSDEFGAMCAHVNAVAGRLQAAIVQVSESSTHVSAATNSLQTSARGLASGVDEAASQVNAIATAGEEMSATTAEIAQNCAKAAKSAERSDHGGGGHSGDAGSLGRIGEMVAGTARAIQGLQERSDRIGQVVELINDIADQTSLLALNAAIEAARAGENGRGFAVVADEVRKLADRTTRATHEIGQTIIEIQKETQEAAQAMDHGVQEVEVGAAEARKSSDSLQQILELIRTVTGEVSQIAVASEQQTSTSEDIAGNIPQVSSVMQQTAEKIQEDAADAEELAKPSGQLRKLVSEFRVFTAADAERMVEEAVAFVSSHGKEAALRGFQDQRGKFSKGELFVYAQDLEGTVLAHSGNPALVGQNHIDLPDAQGKYFVRELVKAAKEAGSGWVDYHFMNPATQRVQPKTTFCRRVGDFMVACGIYS